MRITAQGFKIALLAWFVPLFLLVIVTGLVAFFNGLVNRAPGWPFATSLALLCIVKYAFLKYVVLGRTKSFLLQVEQATALSSMQTEYDGVCRQLKVQIWIALALLSTNAILFITALCLFPNLALGLLPFMLLNYCRISPALETRVTNAELKLQQAGLELSEEEGLLRLLVTATSSHG